MAESDMIKELNQLRDTRPNFFACKNRQTRENILMVLLANPSQLTGSEFPLLIQSILQRVYECPHPRPNLNQSIEINRCLRLVNDVIGIPVQTTEPRLRQFRRSSLPKQRHEMERLDSVIQEAEGFLHNRPGKLTQPEQLVWLCTLLGSMGYGYRVATHIVQQLTKRDLTEGHFSVSVHPDEAPGYCHERFWPIRVLQSLRGIARSLRLKRSERVINVGELKAQLGLDAADGLESVLASAWKQVFKDRIGPRSFIQHLRLNALLNDGLPPALFEALNTLPLPVEAAGGLGVLCENVKPTPEPITSAVESKKPSKADVKQAWSQLVIARSRDETTRLVEGFISADWQINSTNVLKRFSRTLARLPDRFKTRAQKKQLEELVEETLESLWLPPYAAPCLGLRWIQHLLTRDTRPVKNETARQYLSQVIINGFLVHEHSYRLHEWDNDDHDDLFLRLGLTEASGLDSSEKAQRLNQFVRFWCSVSDDVFPEWGRPSTPNAYIQRKHRNTLIRPMEFDKFFATLFQATQANASALAVVSAMAFYGGTRANEALNLKLSDIRLVGGEIWLTVRHSKTLSGTRRIPLHLFAPARVLELCRQYLQSRLQLQQHLGVESKAVYALGPFANTGGFDRRQFIDPGLVLIRHYLGADVDLHGLRHCFATWLLIRVAVFRNDIYPHMLRDRDHELFDQKKLRLLEHAFNPRDRAQDFIIVRKLIGHATFGMTLSTYTHCFGLLVSSKQVNASSNRIFDQQEVVIDPRLEVTQGS